MSGKQTGHVIPLVKNRFLIGREEDCHLRPNSDLVSRHHCVFKVDDYSLRLRDLGSTNGTLVNGERLHGEVMLNSGDRVKVGKLEFEIAIGDEAQISLTVPAGADASEPTDTFELGETPAQLAAGEVSATNAPNLNDTVYHMPAYAQDTAAPQGGDTMLGGMTPPPGYGQQPMGYPMPYLQQQYPYGQPYGMPMMGYPQQPMPYPQMGMGMYPPQQMPMQPPPMPADRPTPPAAGPAFPEVRLPDPSQTGAQQQQPTPTNNGEKKISTADATRNTAADIIKQYTQRRPQV
jgi:predicted component of type VI protein secretion system